VTQDRTTLRRVLTATGDVTTLKSGLTDLLRPQFTRYGEVWALGRQEGNQKLWLFTAETDIEQPKTEVTPIEVDTPVLDSGGVTAFRISPDGCRIALVRKTGKGSELGLARIIRGEDKVTVDGWRTVDVRETDGTRITRMADVAWLDATELLLLGAATKDGPMGPVRVTGDGSRIAAERGEPLDWRAQELTVLSRPQTTIVVGADGKTWRDDGSSQWLPFLDHVKTIAYPG
jgi:hypothetical protein